MRQQDHGVSAATPSRSTEEREPFRSRCRALPGATRQRYDAKDLAVSDTSPFPAKPVAVTAGYVEINRGEHRAVVAVTTSDGEFWANGSYPLR